ncbi:PRTRC system protein B [Cupriavidus basilensis]|uniref:PRTRC system protein B n=1 Tax=Cupriavidus basilensis TaxID=68895 RepID=A0ABT6AFR0_9BURK|nr:PRTRC system protein B [Cupriavidus basilensis]MDF3831430.1 PRTRC system protein B [Cupriavidus basilensis]
MNEAEFSIHTPRDGILKLERAVLIYQGASGSALATVHDVEDVDGEPVIGAGQAMTPRTALELARALLKRAAHGGFLPETVLYMDGDLILWWVPPARRHIAFRMSEQDAPKLGAVERGEAVPQPGLVFAASSRIWRVWAVKGNARPTPATELFQAPYFNVDAQGHICQGNVPKPEGTTAEKIGAWNDAFFRSYFTHPNGAGRLVRCRGGAYAFWRDMLDGRYPRFPERVLVPSKTTLGALLGLPEGA